MSTEPPRFTLYCSPDSANYVVRAYLDMQRLGYSDRPVDRSRNQQRSAAYLALNPQGLLPVLTDGDAVLFETGAILLHLSEAADDPAYTEPSRRAELLKWLFWVSNTFHADLRLAFYTHRYTGDVDAQAVVREGVRARVSEHLGLLEGALEQRQTLGLTGDTASAADVYALICLRWALLYPGGAPALASDAEDRRPHWTARWPRLAALAATIERDPGFRRATAAEAIPVGAPLTAPQRPDVDPDLVTATSNA
ncbi:MAG: glutathione S-transferase family protein [Pseudomonadota bacterium]